MTLEKGTKLYVRVDRRSGGKNLTDQDFNAHMDYVGSIAVKRYFLGGGFANADGGMIIIEAGSLEEARDIFNNDPLIKNGLYACDIFEWDLSVVS